MLQRVMPELMGMKNVLVLNDEAHHCYREKSVLNGAEACPEPCRRRPIHDDEDLTGDDKKEAEKNNEAARLWISGLETVKRKIGICRVIDLSATPFFLRGSGYAEGTLFSWTMSDFSLMDAIECGIKAPPCFQRMARRIHSLRRVGIDADGRLGYKYRHHVLGVRAFGTQLLCEQVIGRALRRQSYDLNEDDLFNVEYADVLGIPFDFTTKPVVAPPQPPRQTIQVKAVRPERDALEITFPRVQGYRVELPEERLTAAFNDDSILELTPDFVGPSVTQNASIIGESVNLNLVHTGDLRQSTLLFHLTHRLLHTKSRDQGEEAKLHLFGQLKRITK